MVTNSHPFKRAILNDSKYKEIARKDYNSFWRKVTYGQKYKFSEDFKDLV